VSAHLFPCHDIVKISLHLNCYSQINSYWSAYILLPYVDILTRYLVRKWRYRWIFIKVTIFDSYAPIGKLCWLAYWCRDGCFVKSKHASNPSNIQIQSLQNKTWRLLLEKNSREGDSVYKRLNYVVLNLSASGSVSAKKLQILHLEAPQKFVCFVYLRQQNSEHFLRSCCFAQFLFFYMKRQ